MISVCEREMNATVRRLTLAGTQRSLFRFGSARGDERWIGSTRKGGSCVGETSADARVQSKGG